jgi:hypothetical protein
MRILTFISFLLVSACAKCQPIQTVKLTDSLLENGTFKVATVKYEFPEEIKMLQSKCIKNLLANPEWADKYIVIMVKNGSPDLRFMDAYGLTKDEFKIMDQGFKNQENAILQDTFNLTIIKRNGLITFKAGKRLTPFNYLSVDLKNKRIIYDYYQIDREVKLEGKHYAPILYGYEAFAFDAPTIRGKKKISSVSVGAFSIGRNLKDSRTTIVLVIQKSLTESDNIAITLLK